MTSLGKFQATWEHPAKSNRTARFVYKVSWSTPQNTTGTVTLPGLNAGQKLVLDRRAVNESGVQGGTLAGKKVVTLMVAGGRHVLVVE